LGLGLGLVLGLAISLVLAFLKDWCDNNAHHKYTIQVLVYN